MNLPIPTHLQPYFVPGGEENDEFGVLGKMHCPCGCEDFEVWESNGHLIIRLICRQCGRDILLFDDGKHGWNGFVCKDDFMNREESLKKYTCAECGRDAFGVTVRIASQGKEDFLEECIAHDDSFSEEQWVDAFEWITVGLFCKGCEHNEPEWADHETM